jgi:hypothetical protein
VERLRAATQVPPADTAREHALLNAFAAHHASPRRARVWGWCAGLAAAAALAIAIGIGPAAPGRRGRPAGDGPAAQGAASLRGVPAQPAPGEFVPWPGSSGLPPLESGELVRMDLPVSMLPSLGVTPPAHAAASVKADVVIGQDGLARAVRLVSD